MLQDTSCTHLHTDHTDRSMVGVNAPSSADFDVRLDALRDALSRRISILEHIDFQYITKNIIRRPHSPKAIRNRRDAYPESTEPQKVRQHVTAEKKLTRVGAPTNLKELSINKL